MDEATDMPVIQKPKKKIPFWSKIFAIIVAFSMVGWVLATYLDKEDHNNMGNVTLLNVTGYSIYALPDGTFGTFIKGQNGKEIPIAFRLDPRNASAIPLDDSAVNQILTSKKIYVVVDPDEKELAKLSVAAFEISRIPPLYGVEVVGAYSKDSNPPNPNVPIRTCNDVTETNGVIYLQVGNVTEIKVVNGCVHIVGANADELILAADKLGYNLVGIKI
jgi:hypothetical protein